MSTFGGFEKTREYMKENSWKIVMPKLTKELFLDFVQGHNHEFGSELSESAE
jgi:hypothetical protein